MTAPGDFEFSRAKTLADAFVLAKGIDRKSADIGGVMIVNPNGRRLEIDLLIFGQCCYSLSFCLVRVGHCVDPLGVFGPTQW